MKLIDVNVLLLAVNRKALHHDRVRNWLESAIAGDEPIVLTWLVVLGFLRLATRPGVFTKPLPIEDATQLVDDWLAQSNVPLIVEPNEHWRFFQIMLCDSQATGNLVNDAYLASLADALGATVVSCDTDFSRFPHVRWENPLAASA